MKNEVKIARASTLIIFLALIRTIAEPIRLNYVKSVSAVSFNEIIPFIYGALIAAIGLLIMTIFSYYGKNRIVIAIAILIIILLLFVKFSYDLK